MRLILAVASIDEQQVAVGSHTAGCHVVLTAAQSFHHIENPNYVSFNFIVNGQILHDRDSRSNDLGSQCSFDACKSTGKAPRLSSFDSSNFEPFADFFATTVKQTF